MQSNISVFDIANYFINYNYDLSSESFITPLKLQKLCYYAQAYYIATYGEKLIKEDFQAWVHGPVCPELYEKYKKYGMQPIIPEEAFDRTIFTDKQLKILDYVQKEYGIYDGKFLEYITHQEKPWKNARKGYLPDEICDVVIDCEDMKKEYSKVR